MCQICSWCLGRRDWANLAITVVYGLAFGAIAFLGVEIKYSYALAARICQIATIPFVLAILVGLGILYFQDFEQNGHGVLSLPIKLTLFLLFWSSNILKGIIILIKGKTAKYPWLYDTEFMSSISHDVRMILVTTALYFFIPRLVEKSPLTDSTSLRRWYRIMKHVVRAMIVLILAETLFAEIYQIIREATHEEEADGKRNSQIEAFLKMADPVNYLLTFEYFGVLLGLTWLMRDPVSTQAPPRNVQADYGAVQIQNVRDPPGDGPDPQGDAENEILVESVGCCSVNTLSKFMLLSAVPLVFAQLLKLQTMVFYYDETAAPDNNTLTVPPNSTRKPFSIHPRDSLDYTLIGTIALTASQCLALFCLHLVIKEGLRRPQDDDEKHLEALRVQPHASMDKTVLDITMLAWLAWMVLECVIVSVPPSDSWVTDEAARLNEFSLTSKQRNLDILGSVVSFFTAFFQTMILHVVLRLKIKDLPRFTKVALSITVGLLAASSLILWGEKFLDNHFSSDRVEFYNEPLVITLRVVTPVSAMYTFHAFGCWMNFFRNIGRAEEPFYNAVEHW